MVSVQGKGYYVGVVGCGFNELCMIQKYRAQSEYLVHF